MKNYKYTENWFSFSDLEQFLPLNTQEELHILEIGSFEGKSTIWFLENILQNPNSTITCIDPWTSYSQDSKSFESYFKTDAEWDFTSHYNTFLYNTEQSGVFNKVIINQGFSHDILPKLITQNKQYNIIYDGMWVNNKKDGFGTLYNENGIIYSKNYFIYINTLCAIICKNC